MGGKPSLGWGPPAGAPNCRRAFSGPEAHRRTDCIWAFSGPPAHKGPNCKPPFSGPPAHKQQADNKPLLGQRPTVSHYVANQREREAGGLSRVCGLVMNLGVHYEPYGGPFGASY